MILIKKHLTQKNIVDLLLLMASKSADDVALLTDVKEEKAINTFSGIFTKHMKQ